LQAELDVHVAVGRVVVAEEVQGAQDSHPGRLARNEDHRLLRVLRRARIGLAHHDEELAARIARPR